MTDTPTRPTAASRFARAETDLAAATRALAHIPHPHLARRAAAGPVRTADQLPAGSAVARFNTRVALLITRAVGSMWCAYLFAAFDLISLPTSIHHGTSTIVAWVAQTFLQLVLLSVIMVGQNVQASAADARAKATFDDGEALLQLADGHVKSITHLRAELEQGLAHVHAKLEAMHKTVLTAAAHPILTAQAAAGTADVQPPAQVDLNVPGKLVLDDDTTAALAKQLGQHLDKLAQSAAAAAPSASPPLAEPTSPATAPPSSPPADGPTGTPSTS